MLQIRGAAVRLFGVVSPGVAATWFEKIFCDTETASLIE